MKHKIVSVAAITVTAIATVSVAAQEMANACKGELTMKLMAFISLMLIDIYAIVEIFKDDGKD